MLNKLKEVDQLLSKIEEIDKEMELSLGDSSHKDYIFITSEIPPALAEQAESVTVEEEEKDSLVLPYKVFLSFPGLSRPVKTYLSHGEYRKLKDHVPLSST